MRDLETIVADNADPTSYYFRHWRDAIQNLSRSVSESRKREDFAKLDEAFRHERLRARQAANTPWPAKKALTGHDVFKPGRGF